ADLTLTGEEDLRAAGLTVTKAQGAVKLERGVLRLRELRGGVEKATLTADGEVRLRESLPFTLRATLADADLALLQRLPRESRPDLSLRGTLTVEGRGEGNLTPF